MSYTHAYEKVHWSLVDLPRLSFGRGRGTILEGYDSGYVKILSSPLSHQLSITFQLELGHMTRFPFHTRMLTGLTLCYSCKGQLQLLWVLRAMVLSKPEDSVLLFISQDYGSYSFFCLPFYDCPWALGGRPEIKPGSLVRRTLRRNYTEKLQLYQNIKVL